MHKQSNIMKQTKRTKRDNYSNLYALENFFSNMPNITRIADLILDVSGKYCYYETFANLKNIEETPEFSNISRLREY